MGYTIRQLEALGELAVDRLRGEELRMARAARIAAGADGKDWTAYTKDMTGDLDG